VKITLTQLQKDAEKKSDEFTGSKLLRLFAWWVLGQLLDLCKLWQEIGGSIPASLEKEVNYFAFGANLSKNILAERRIFALRSRPFGLRNHILKFNQAGPYVGSAFASVHEQTGSTVYGELMTISTLDLWRMHSMELVPFLKKHRVINFEQSEDRGFFYQATITVDGLAPTDIYLDKIMGHMKKNPLVPSTYLQAFAEQKTCGRESIAKDVYFLMDYRQSQGLRRIYGSCKHPCFSPVYTSALENLGLTWS